MIRRPPPRTPSVEIVEGRIGYTLHRTSGTTHVEGALFAWTLRGAYRKALRWCERERTRQARRRIRIG